MQTQTKFCVYFNKINAKFFSGDSKLPLIPLVGPSPRTKVLFLRLSAWDDELLTTPKVITFPPNLLPKLHEPALSNFIP